MNQLEKTLESIAQIPVESSPNKEVIQRTYAQSNNTDYILGYAAVALVATFGYLGLWLKKYFETRLEMSIERQKEEFSNTKEDRDKAQRVFDEDRKRAQDQADLFLTTTLETIKEEKENNLNALNRVAQILEKVDGNQAEMMHDLVVLASDVKTNTLRIESLSITIDNVQGKTQVWSGDERRNLYQ